MKSGLEIEPVAADEYKDITGNKVYPCGFVINPHSPHLDSPDRKVSDFSAAPAYGILEIKCSDKDSFKDCVYLYCKADGTYALKTTHEDYFQVGITGRSWCDFFVRCKQDYHLERIYFNPKEWENMKSKIDIFFFTYFLPA